MSASTMTFIDLSQLARFAAALIFVLCLMGGLALVLRRIKDGQLPGTMGAKRRLKIVEILPLDARRRLVLLRRDSVEHLVILGTDGETVIETGIESPQDGADERK